MRLSFADREVYLMTIPLRIKHSSVSGKAPQPEDLRAGELALNINEETPAAYFKDSAGNVIKIAGPDVADGRYLKLNSDAGAQVVQSTDETEFKGLTEHGGGIKINGGASAEDTIVASNTGLPTGGMLFNATNRMLLGNPGKNNGLNVVAGELDKSKMASALRVDFASTGHTEEVNGIVSDITQNTGAPEVNIFKANNPTAQLTANILCGFRSVVNSNKATAAYNFYAGGLASNYFKGSTYIGGSTARNTLELFKSTLTEEQLEAFEIGKIAVPSSVSSPGDGKYARAWYYDQQSAEDQALIDSGEIDYPKHLQAATFTDTFALGDNSNINLKDNGDIESALSISVGKLDETSTTSQGVNLTNGGFVKVQKPEGATGTLWYGYQGTTLTSQITAGGTISTLGSVITEGKFRVDGTENVNDEALVIKQGDTTQAAISTNGNAVFTRVQATNNVTISGSNVTSATTLNIEAGGSGALVFKSSNANNNYSFVANGDIEGRLRFNLLEQNRVYEFPNKNGTLALVSDIAKIMVGEDSKFKENITPAKSQLADVVALGGMLKNYDWSNKAPLSKEARSQHQLGLIADEAELVCPDAIVTVPCITQGEELSPAIIDSDGCETQEATFGVIDESYKAVSQDILVMKLLGAVAELKAEVDALKGN